MNKELIKSAAIKLARADSWDIFKNSPQDFPKFLEHEREIIKNQEATKALYTAKKAPMWQNGLKFGLGIIGVTLIADAISDALKTQYQQYKSKDYFEKMMEMHPQLQREDPLEIAKYWNSLNHFAPHVAADPLASGAYITQSIRRLSGEQLGGPPPDTFNTLTQIQKQHVEGNPDKGKTSINSSARNEAVSQIVKGMYGS